MSVNVEESSKMSTTNSGEAGNEIDQEWYDDIMDAEDDSLGEWTQPGFWAKMRTWGGAE